MKTRMSKISFSANQQKALNLAAKNMLVSAGAGSGKTAVLIERLYRLYTEKAVPVSDVLVLVFGRLAANELKERIRAKLANDAAYAHLIPEIEVANIVTFDAFALQIVKQYGVNLNISPRITNLDEVTLKVKFREYYNMLLEEQYVTKPPLFLNFMNKYHTRSEQTLFNFLLDFHYEVGLQIDEEAYLNNYITTFYSVEAFSKYTTQTLKRGKNILREIITVSKQLSDNDYYEKFAVFQEIHDKVTSLDDFLALRPEMKRSRLPNKYFENFSDDKDIINTIDAYLKTLKEEFAFPDTATLAQQFNEECEYARFIVEFYQQINAKLAAFKKMHNAYTFSDISKLAYKLVKDPLIGNELRATFAYILIDEYQDTSDIQEVFVQAISKDNVYMVGDIKQSIYGFRNANPQLFKRKYRDYLAGNNGELVVLNDNYRSRLEVIAPINNILSEIMSETHGGAAYASEHIITAANTKYLHNQVAEKRFVHKTTEIPADLTLAKYEAEVRIVLNDIIAKVNDGYEIYDLKNDVYRPVTYGDFTILLRDATRFDDIEQMFIAAGVPLFIQKDETIHDDQIMLAVRSALIIYLSYTKEEAPSDYKYRHAVASFLRSFIIGYSDEKLYHLFNTDGAFALDPHLNTFKELAANTAGFPPLSVINAIIDTFDVYAKLYELGDIYLNSSKLSATLRELAKFSDYHYTLSEIITYFDDLITLKSSLEVKRTKLAANAVNMLTMHGSKGLEYPIVYYFMLDKKAGGQSKAFSVTKHYGFVFPNFYGRSFQYYLHKDEENNRELSELIRLLYVALTRSKEDIIVVSSTKAVKDKDKEVAQIPLARAKTMLDILNNSRHFNALKENVDLPTSAKKVKETVTLREGVPPHVKTLAYEFIKRPVSPSAYTESTFTELGTLYHRYIELYDFNKCDLSYVSDAQMRDVLTKLFRLPLFAKITTQKVIHEYAYLDEGREKIIDMFIVNHDHILLFDFKLKDITNPDYVAQILTYKRYLRLVYNLPVKAYLVSIVDAKYVEVSDE